jgi:hypothetical protein
VLAELLRQYEPVVRRVIQQTTRRVFQRESAPAPDKIVSLFEPQTAIIRRGKATRRKPSLDANLRTEKSIATKLARRHRSKKVQLSSC